MSRSVDVKEDTLKWSFGQEEAFIELCAIGFYEDLNRPNLPHIWATVHAIFQITEDGWEAQ